MCHRGNTWLQLPKNARLTLHAFPPGEPGSQVNRVEKRPYREPLAWDSMPFGRQTLATSCLVRDHPPRLVGYRVPVWCITNWPAPQMCVSEAGSHLSAQGSMGSESRMRRVIDLDKCPGNFAQDCRSTTYHKSGAQPLSHDWWRALPAQPIAQLVDGVAVVGFF